jgi:hypothetical protein
MRNYIVIAGLILLVLLASSIGWQITSCYVANSELQSDLNDLAAQNAFRIGLAPLPTEVDLRNSVLARARDHGIDLESQQVTVERTLTPDALRIFLAVDYETHPSLLTNSFTLHFNPSSSHTTLIPK